MCLCRICQRLAPWPSRSDRKDAIDEARDRYQSASAIRRESEELADELRELRHRNHFRDMFEAALRRDT